MDPENNILVYIIVVIRVDGIFVSGVVLLGGLWLSAVGVLLQVAKVEYGYHEFAHRACLYVIWMRTRLFDE